MHACEHKQLLCVLFHISNFTWTHVVVATELTSMKWWLGYVPKATSYKIHHNFSQLNILFEVDFFIVKHYIIVIMMIPHHICDMRY